ncbi:N-6 DNA methylase [Rhizobium leguminosarum]|uniref:N-6 DNA methylase n=1 Tax=Rhizobium leguminosarum TaxID=384 RepID=UPI001C93F397|nr:N-6 DNA methylase [Rhizobium leguminosarum]MBY5523556.1 SAM-dependent DNA methyltransferase [Rhizobium leguminosarum]
MSALQTIEGELRKLGYTSETLIHDYSFADVLSASGEQRRVDLAAFTQVPESYRSAAFAVISGAVDEAAIIGRRSLGAPILFAIGQDDVGVWRVGAHAGPRLIERVALDALPELFRRNAESWRPLAVHRAKSLSQHQAAYQLDFVDLGLIPAIEREVEVKLDRLLGQVIRQLLKGLDDEREESAFRATFRLLAAKILLDREHPDALSWADAPVADVLAGIEEYYNLGKFSTTLMSDVPAASVAAAWAMLREAISFRNISSDSLAFVYENTLVTADTRKRFGTHSTPRQVAEYLVSRLDLNRFDVNNLTIFEPFTGAGTLLVAALRHLRDLLPEGLSAEQRHAFLVSRIHGAEIDTFACEVATLSLILADYPNANGWKIQQADLFRDNTLTEKAASGTVVLCNPPWEDFNAAERREYPTISAKSISKPMAVLRTVLESRPAAVGFVLPQGFLRQKQYSELRQQVADLYQEVELTSLPDNIFQRAGFEASLLVANDLRDNGSAGPVRLLSSVVNYHDRTQFLATRTVSSERRRSKQVTEGNLWIGALDELWEQLDRFPQLGAMAEVYRGLQWRKQEDGRSHGPRSGFVRGVFKPSESLAQFEISAISYLDMSTDNAMYPGPLGRPWSSPKVLTNVARLSRRGPWRIAAAYDATGLVVSQAFFGIWPTDDNLSAEALEAVLNGPLTNAFLFERASNQHFTNELLKQLPMPKRANLDAVVDAVRRYKAIKVLARDQEGHQPDEINAVLNQHLVEIDAEVLKAYDLAPRLERRLLEFFRGHERERRTGHGFTGWLPREFTAYIPLHEYLGPLVKENLGAWAIEAFKPAPEEEVAMLRRYLR